MQSLRGTRILSRERAAYPGLFGDSESRERDRLNKAENRKHAAPAVRKTGCCCRQIADRAAD